MNECMTQEDAEKMSNEQAVAILKPMMDMMRDQYECPISDAYFALGKAIEALSAQPDWIPCSERSPEKSEEYDPDSWPVISMICFIILIIGFAISAIF